MRKRLAVSKKLLLDQRVAVRIAGKNEWNTVEYWIENKPDVLYRHVYEPIKHQLRRIQLCTTAVEKLKEALSEKHPILANKIQSKKERKKNVKLKRA